MSIFKIIFLYNKINKIYNFYNFIFLNNNNKTLFNKIQINNNTYLSSLINNERFINNDSFAHIFSKRQLLLLILKLKVIKLIYDKNIIFQKNKFKNNELVNFYNYLNLTFFKKSELIDQLDNYICKNLFNYLININGYKLNCMNVTHLINYLRNKDMHIFLVFKDNQLNLNSNELSILCNNFNFINNSCKYIISTLSLFNKDIYKFLILRKKISFSSLIFKKIYLYLSVTNKINKKVIFFLKKYINLII
jgi:hypothetical protein